MGIPSGPRQSPWRNRARRAVGSVFVRAVVTALLLALVASQVNWSAAADRLVNGSWAWFAAAVATLFASQLLAAARWRLLLAGVGLERAPLAVIRAYLIGVFVNSFLPTAVGGDVARAWLVASRERALVRALLSVVVDRFLAFWALVALAWILLPTDPTAVPSSLVLALLALSVGGIASSALMLWFALYGGGRLARRLPRQVLEWAREIREALRLYRARPRLLAIAALLGLGFQLLVVGAVWLIANAIDLNVALSLLAVVTPLVLAVTLVPISIAGFGVREGGMVLFLGAAGYSATEATLLSLTGVGALVVSSLPGAAAMVLGKYE
jgi:uncharacterized protein (TIRG00374 family)